METKNCQNCKKDFVIEQEDFNFYEKIKVPAPTFCPECRMIRRFHFRNEGMLFRRKDGHDGKEIFSGFSPEAKVTTYENSFWFGGDWDPFVNGRDYDFSRSFFEQMKELLEVAPIPARSVFNMINSDYCNEASECKNCYLCFNTDYIENSAYLRKIRYVKDSFDCYEVEENELCYENILVDKSYQTFFALDCETCVDVWFSKGLRGCTNCFGCVNLRNKSYHFFNEPYSKEEYIEKVKEYMTGSYEQLTQLKEIVQKFWLQFPDKFYHGIRTVNSTGERLFDSKNVKNSYYVKRAEDVRYCQDIWTKTNSCYDYSVWGDGAENIYECMTCGMGISNVKFSFNTWENVQDAEYCIYSIGSKNCFGCVGLYKKQYCILNKQYSKEEYFIMVEKIKKQMMEIPYIDHKGRVFKYGEFFPYDMSPNAYNESLAQDFFPLKKEEILEKGYQWRDINKKEYEITIDSKDLPDNINNIDESISKEVIGCKNCLRAFRVIASEFQFYKRFNLPIPRFCSDCRCAERFKLVNPPKLWHRKCMNTKIDCQNEFETSYDPEKPGIIYCEKCFQSEVY